jgi:hypothetical protein
MPTSLTPHDGATLPTAPPHEEWLTLVEKFGLGTLVADDPEGGIRRQWVIVLAFVALTVVLMLWAIIHQCRPVE